MKNEYDVKISAWMTGIFLTAIWIIRGIASPSDFISAISSSVGLMFIVRYGITRWVWKWIPPLGKLYGVISIEGKWQGPYQSNFVDTETGVKKSGTVKVSISQPNLFSIKISQESGESHSNSYTEQLNVREDGIELFFSYLLEPIATTNSRHKHSFGSARYRYSKSENEEILKGNYWTDQGSTGHIELRKIQ